MSNIILSICIPTYNRSKLVSECVRWTISCPSQEIEIVVSDNASTDGTQEAIKKINDPRVKYYRNDENIGYPANILKLAERATGDFLLYISDEDRVAVDEIPWILNIIKTNKNITHILGSIGKMGSKKISKAYKDEILKAGYESLTKLFWDYSHGSGIIFKREVLDLNHAKKYLGTALEPYMDLILETQAMVAGDTLCTSRILCYVGEIQLESRQPLFQGRPYWHPVNRVFQLKERIKLICDLTNEKRTQKALLKKQMLHASNYPVYAFTCIFRPPYSHFSDILRVLRLLLSIKEVRRNPYFWFNLPIQPIRRAITYIKRKVGHA